VACLVFGIIRVTEISKNQHFFRKLLERLNEPYSDEIFGYKALSMPGARDIAIHTASTVSNGNLANRPNSGEHLMREEARSLRA
jgi:hypothetical protein